MTKQQRRVRAARCLCGHRRAEHEDLTEPIGNCWVIGCECREYVAMNERALDDRALTTFLSDAKRSGPFAKVVVPQLVAEIRRLGSEQRRRSRRGGARKL